MRDKLRQAYEDQSHSRLDAAERGFQEILSSDPQNAMALRGLGLVHHLRGAGEKAVSLLRAAVNAGNDDPIFRSNLAAVLGHLGRHEEAAHELRLALATRPSFAEAWQNLGVALEKQGKLEEAVDAHRKAVSLTPSHAPAHEFLGNALLQLRRWTEAEAAYRAALALTPSQARLHQTLGEILQKLKRPREAATEFEKAIACDPTSAAIRVQLGRLYDANGKYFAAASILEKAIALAPHSQDAHWIAAHSHGELGNLDQTLKHLRQSVALAPNSPSAHSALLYTLHYDARSTPATLFDEHLEWGRRHAEPLQRLRRPHDNDRDPNRRLRIGYVSPDFRDHTVPRFISAAIQHHDREQFETFCYSNSHKKDAVTAKLQMWAEQWREIADLNDEKAEQLIRDDRIDILIDLRGHAGNNRLTLFARKPAPVQGVMVGYFNTTGVSAIDYRITDEWQDPTGKSDRFHVEKLARLPHGAWCYSADENAPPVDDLPALRSGSITFGCLNKILKVVPKCAQLWGELLRLVPKSHLLLVAPEADRTGHLKRRLNESGIDSNQLTILDKAPSRLEYLRRFNQIDICLDPFPFNGITTTCDGLWMGVPTVSLTGETTISRVGSGILAAAGLSELVAHEPQNFLRIVSDLADNKDRLQQLRRGLRERIKYSDLMNGNQFTQELEISFRKMWSAWLTL
jgi:protein O-GlcNAc transferase